MKKISYKVQGSAKKPFDMGKFFTRVFPAPLGVFFLYAVFHGGNIASLNTNFLIVVGFVFLLWVLINIFAPDFFG